MQESQVKEWLHDECVSVLKASSAVSLSNPASHVDHAEERDDQTYPFIGLRTIASNSESAGIGSGDVYVENVTYQNGVAQDVTYKRVPTLRVELLPLTSDDRQLQSTLADELVDHFSVLARRSDHPSDIIDVEPEESSPQNREDEYVYADGIPVEVTYERYVTESVTAAETVNVDVDVSETVSDDSDDADAFYESF